MAGIVQWLRLPLPHAAALALTTITVAACSGDSSRFNDNPFSSGSEATGSIQPGSAASASRVESQPLPQLSQHPQSPSSNGTGSGVAGGGRGMASYAPNANPGQPGTSPPPEVTGAIAAPKPAA